MIDPVRQEIAATSDTIVVKIGTRALTLANGDLDLDQVTSIAGQISALMDAGRRVVLVSSGAVGAGIGRLGLKERPTDLAQLQAAAAVGQSRMIECYNQALQQHGRHAAQVLLTADDLNDRRRYLNTRNTLFALFEYGAVPIINENDTVRVHELKLSFGDNDRLAAMVTNLLRAPLLVLLSDIDGLYDGDPALPTSRVIPLIEEMNDSVLELANSTKKDGIQLSTGGMASKLHAALIATHAGENVIVANGRTPGVLLDIFEARTVGTLFLAAGTAVNSRKRWIGWTAQPQGVLQLDAGAEHAIDQEGRSLLAVGITGVLGEFDKGDVVDLVGPSGRPFARGLTNYNAKDVARVLGQPTDRFADLLGHCPYNEVVHRDNLTLLRG